MLKNEHYELYFVDGTFKKINIERKCEDYYNNQRNNKYYGIKFDLNDIDDEHKLSFYVEIDHNIYYGFTLFNKKNKIRTSNKNKVFENILNKIYKANDWESRDNSWWACWKYPKDKINFWNFNTEIMYKLADKTKQYDIVNNLANEIIETLKQYKEKENR